MSNKSKNSFSFNAAAANCKKVLKSLNVKKTVALMALTTFTAASAAVLAVSATGSVALDANLIANAASETAVKTAIPPKEYNVKISVDGKNLGIKCAGTVNDALAAAKIDIYDDDLINIGFNEPLNANTEIIVNRVNIVEEVQIETIEYATRYKEDNNYTIGYSEVVVDGEEGEVETTLRHVYIDGELISSSVVDEDITEPVDKVVLVGTKEYNPIDDFSISQIPAPMDLTLDANGVPTSYQKVLTGKSCAYSARPGAGTASGRKAMVGCVAVDPNIIPYGTELYITTTDGSAVYGYAIAADTGTALVEGQILVDLFMESYDASCDWGARQVNIYIL
ncbi:MAG: G5 domain-containing protein [Oscillospiraceae bacterium]|nr:G5 domain-containing protein [Oscillospiraceae bacterium]